MVWSDLVGVSIILNDLTSQRNDVPRKVSNEEDVTCAQKFCRKECIKVRTREGGNVPAGTGEVCSDQFLVVAFMCIQKDIAEGG